MTLRLAGSLLPIAAFGGALLGTTLRDIGDDIDILIIAIMSSILAIGAPQPLAHQLFNENPFSDLFEDS